MDLRQTIEEIALPFLDAMNAFIVDLQIVHEDHRNVVRFFVDTDSGITVGQCTELNRQIGSALELQNVIDHSYVLEVSSPDITKPLKLLRQYRKNIGRRFRVVYRNGIESTKIIATLEGIEGESLIFHADDDGTSTVPFQDIIESIEELPW